MLFLYKRPGQRVIVNAAGRMMVRPTHMEASVQRTTGGMLHPTCVYTHQCCVYTTSIAVSTPQP